MNPRFSNLAVAIVSLTVVAIAERIASVIKVGMAGYPPIPPPRPVITVESEETGTDIEQPSKK